MSNNIRDIVSVEHSNTDEPFQKWITKQRNSIECDEHWDLRLQFLKRNFPSFERETLLCYAQIFVNIQTLGCRYSRKIMEKIKLLAGDIGIKYRQRNSLQRTFVSASEAASDKIQASHERRQDSSNSKASNTHYSQFIPAGISPTTCLQPNPNKRPCDDQATFSNIRPNKVLKMNPSDSTKTGSGSANKFDQIAPLQFSPDKYTMKPDNPLCKFDRRFLQFLSRCVIMIDPNTSFRVTIENFLSKSSIANKFIVDGSDINQWSCNVELFNGPRSIPIGEVCGSAVRSLAIEAASKLALVHLSEICRIVVRRKHCLSEKKDKINLEDISATKSKPSAFSYQAVTDTNIGAKLLKMMGWSGGGLGIRNDGIVEPVSAYSSTGVKQGIGFKQNVDRKQLKMLLDQYVGSNVLEDLIFSPDIPKETRADIHAIVKSNPALKSVSRNEDGNRYLTVRKKIDPKTLADYLASEGGEYGCYKVFLPRTLDLSSVDSF